MCVCVQLKKAKLGKSPAKSTAAGAGPSAAASAGGEILIDSDSDDGAPTQPATARFGSRRLGASGAHAPLPNFEGPLDIYKDEESLVQ